MLGRSIPLALAAAVLVAGCVQLGDDVAPQSLGSLLDPIGLPIEQDHDHSDPALHNASYAMRLVGHTYGYADGAIPDGVGFGELAWNAGYVYQCRMGAAGGYLVIDARDPANPTPVGEMPGLACYDMKTDKTGTLVFWGNQRHPVGQVPSIAGGSDYAPRGLYVDDVTDKTAPKRLAYFPVPPNGLHTVRYYCMEEAADRANASAPCAGRELLFVQTYDLFSAPLGWPELAPVGGVIAPTFTDNPMTQRIIVLEILREEAGARLEEVTVIQERFVPQAGKGFRPHDSYPTQHPVTGDHLLYVAYWDMGVNTYVINDPANPVKISNYGDFLPSAHNAIHAISPSPVPLGGREILVAEPELDVARETGQYTTIDVTDPTEPAKLGYWTLPGGLFIDAPFRFSPHNFNVANGRIYLAHNHAGVWVVNITDPTEPVAAGFYQPHMPREGYTGDIPRVWSAFYHEGLIYASDGGTGLYILQYAYDEYTPPARAPLPGTPTA